ncbi:hypothetical protein D3C71_942490 [compost metagenome]
MARVLTSTIEPWFSGERNCSSPTIDTNDSAGTPESCAPNTPAFFLPSSLKLAVEHMTWNLSAGIPRRSLSLRINNPTSAPCAPL